MRTKSKLISHGRDQSKEKFHQQILAFPSMGLEFMASGGNASSLCTESFLAFTSSKIGVGVNSSFGETPFLLPLAGFHA